MDVGHLVEDIKKVRSRGIGRVEPNEVPELVRALAQRFADLEPRAALLQLEVLLDEAAARLEPHEATGIRLALGIGGLSGNSADRRSRFAAHYGREAETVRRRGGLEHRAFTQLAIEIEQMSGRGPAKGGGPAPTAARAEDLLGGPRPTPAVASRDPWVQQKQVLEVAVKETASRVDTLPDLRAVTTASRALDPAHFLSGASLNGSEVSEYAVPRRIDIDGDLLDVESVASRLTRESMVGYLIAGAGEGKSTYLHELSTSLLSRAIVFRWRVSGHLNWTQLHEFRQVVASLASEEGADELPLVVIGELATKPSREQEDALIEIAQSIPSGLAPARTSIVLAGRPAWLNRIRRGVSTGQTMRLLPLSESESALLIEKMADAYGACLEVKGPAWTNAQFPNVAAFLSLPHARRIVVFTQGPSLVGSLLHAAYGREFIRRLVAEYSDLEEAEREAYLVVSLATSSTGGISEELLELVIPNADLQRSSAGSPWQRDLEGIHSARHEMIGKLIVEDKEASSARDISQVVAKIIAGARSHPEAREIFLSSVRIFDESRSLVPDQRRKTEPQFRAALRAGVLDDHDAWEELERSVGASPANLLSLAYVLHRLLPDRIGRDDYDSLIQDRDDGLIQDHLSEYRCVVTV